MFDFLKNLTKQTIAVGVLCVVAFFAFPGITIPFFVGVAVGLVAGNLYPKVEAFIEGLLERF